MKGLDGIQGPIYAGTGCLFRRHALYGFDAPKNKKDSAKTTSNYLQKFCCCFGFGSRKIKKTKAKLDKKKNIKDDLKQRYSIENIESIEGKKYFGIFGSLSNICISCKCECQILRPK